MDFENDVIDTEEFEEEVIEDTRTRWQKFKDWWKEYKQWIVPFLFTLLGIGIRNKLDKAENNSSVYCTDQDGNTYRVRAKKMKSIKPRLSEEDRKARFDD